LIACALAAFPASSLAGVSATTTLGLLPFRREFFADPLLLRRLDLFGREIFIGLAKTVI
jgi:hypothetical protein